MSVKTTKRLAADILKVGVKRIRIVPSEQKAAKEALTRDDVRGLIKRGAIYAEPLQGVSRRRGRERARQRSLGRRRGKGKRKGGKYSRLPRKRQWIMRVRAQRKLLRKLLDEGRIDHATYRRTYSMVKGGAFKGRLTMVTQLSEAGLLKSKGGKS
ncbi:50S ribosomal protein L19e [Candidatus Micrarchaeota archaeon]|nr:MAG: 50S ribosomal protein L19e [Candidatus Micrarchaeota archaeon]